MGYSSRWRDLCGLFGKYLFLLMCILLGSAFDAGAAPQITAKISAMPLSILSGASSKLTWSTKNATTCRLDPGNISVSLNGTLIVWPTETTTYMLTATGASGTSIAKVTVTVTSVNVPPDAKDDSATTFEDTPVTLSVLANDIDANNDLLKIESFNQPSNGIVVGDGNGTLTYTPNYNFFGSDLFVYKISDSRGGFDTATVGILIQPVNDAPIAVNQRLSTELNTPLDIRFVATDIESDPITYTIQNPPANGNLLANDGDQFITYTPNADFRGIDTFSFRAFDGTNYSAPASITVSVGIPNHPPIATDESLIIVGNVPVTTMNVLENDTDIDDDPVSIVSFTQPIYGSVIQNANNTFVYTPGIHFARTDFFTYTISDGKGGKDVGTVLLVRENTAPLTPPPTVAISAAPSVMPKCGGTTLSWSSEFADIVTIEPGIGSVSVSGSKPVCPNKDTLYSIKVIGSGGTVTDSVLVSVSAVANPKGAPELSVTTDQEMIRPGESVTLSWSTKNARTVSIDNGIGAVAVNGSLTLTPESTVTYTFKAVSIKGIISTNCLTISVSPPLIHFKHSTDEPVYEGQSDYLQWIVEDADAVSIDHGIGSVGSGSYPDIWEQIGITPVPDDPIYTLTAVGKGVISKERIKTGVYPRFEKEIFTSESHYHSYGDDYLEAFYQTVSMSGNYMAVIEFDSDLYTFEHSKLVVYEKGHSVGVNRTEIRTFNNEVIEPRCVSVNGDRIIISSESADYSNGIAYVYKFEDGLWTEESQFSFGDASIELAAIDGNTIVLATISGNETGGYHHEAYFYIRENDGWTLERSIPIPADPQHFPSSLAISGDVAIVGVCRDGTAGFTRAGAVYICERKGTGWELVQTLHAGDMRESQEFGYDVATDGNLIIVGASGSSFLRLTVTVTPYPEIFLGAAYIYKKSNGNWVEEAKLDPTIDNLASRTGPLGGKVYDSNGDTVYFGQSVDIEDGLAVVAGFDVDPGYSDTTRTAGNVYLYQRANGKWIDFSRLESYGQVAIDGRSIAIGPGMNAVASDWMHLDPDWEIGLYETSVQLTSSAEIIPPNRSVTLSWSSINADYCVIEPNIGIVQTAGVIEVLPAETTSYHITAVGLLGVARNDVTVNVATGAPIDIITTDPCNGGSVYITGTSGSIYRVKGKLSKKATVTVNDVIASVGGEEETEFFADIRMVEGINLINIRAVGYSGEYGEKTVTANAVLCGNITGALRDSITSAPVASATVTVIGKLDPQGNPYVVLSDAAGNYSIPSVPYGRVTISISKEGYRATEDSGTLGAGETSFFGYSYLYPFPLVNFSVSPEIITAGGSSTLAWRVQYASTITIDQGIGSVGAIGSRNVTPQSTTTYTLIAIGAGGTTLKTVTVSVQNSMPTVNITATPRSISRGESATLSWTTTNATACSIDQGIGNVPVNGSVTVSPLENTTYTITATGQSGTSTATVIVTVVQPPQVIQFAASPQRIYLGESATLAWSVSGADTVQIDQGVGSMPTNGSVAVNPTRTTTYTLTATGAGGTITASVTVEVKTVGIHITSPIDGQNISRPDVMVEGTITNPSGREIGVIVNGVLAFVYGNQFAANHVPLRDGANTLTAAATDTDGVAESDSIAVTAGVQADYIRIMAMPESGISPLESTLKVDGSFTITESAVSYSGPGTVEFIEGTADEYHIKTIVPGIYHFTASITREANVYTDTVAVVVSTMSELDAKLKGVFTGVKTALAAGNVDKAAAFFTSRSRERYRTAFNSLSDKLTLVAADMQDIELIYAHEDIAKYRIRRTENVNGEMTSITYYLYFRVDIDGNWRVEQF